MKHIVVIGAGYAGIGAAQTAAKILSKDEVKITVLEKRPYFFHALGSLRAMIDTSFIPKILIPFDNAFNGATHVDIKLGSVDSISFEARTVSFMPSSESSAAPSLAETISYDYLIIATGSSNPSPIKPAGDSESREGMVNHFTLTAKKIKDSERILVIGAGAVGIEAVGELKFYYPNKKIMLLDSNDEILSGSNVPKLRKPVMKALVDSGIKLYLGQRLKGKRYISHHFGKQNLTTESGLTIETDAVLVCAGMHPNIDLMTDPKCIEGRFIKVKPTMEVDGPIDVYKNVFVVGDASNHQTPKMGFWGMEQGKHIAKGISANIRKGRAYKPFKVPSTEMMLLPMGPDGGYLQLPFWGGFVLGNFITSKLKSKNLLSDRFWGELNAKIPTEDIPRRKNALLSSKLPIVVVVLSAIIMGLKSSPIS